jgi:hypothetical protein
MGLEDYYLPTDALKKVLIGTIFITDGNYEELAIELIKVLADSGYHPDAVKWGMTYTDGILCLYKQVPCLDIWNHLNIS